MTDQTSESFGQMPARTRGIEYRIYFAIIFLISLPLCFVTCTLGLVRPDAPDCGRNFVSRAWRQATIITPMIFSA